MRVGFVIIKKMLVSLESYKNLLKQLGISDPGQKCLSLLNEILKKSMMNVCHRLLLNATSSVISDEKNIVNATFDKCYRVR